MMWPGSRWPETQADLQLPLVQHRNRNVLLEKFVLSLFDGADVDGWLEYGASPRGTISLDRCARAHAWLQGRDFVSPDDVQEIMFDVLRHRILLSFEAEASGITPDKVLETIRERVPSA